MQVSSLLARARRSNKFTPALFSIMTNLNLITYFSIGSSTRFISSWSRILANAPRWTPSFKSHGKWKTEKIVDPSRIFSPATKRIGKTFSDAKIYNQTRQKAAGGQSRSYRRSSKMIFFSVFIIYRH